MVKPFMDVINIDDMVMIISYHLRTGPFLMDLALIQHLWGAHNNSSHQASSVGNSLYYMVITTKFGY